MNIFSKIFTALKGGANEMGEAVVDANAITIFEQDIRDAKAALAGAKENEISLFARKRQAQAKMSLHQSRIEEYENQAIAAAEKGNEALALETASHIVNLQEEKQTMQASIDALSQSCDKIAAQVSKAQAQIDDMESQLSQIKATDSVHKAQESIHATVHGGSSKVVSAKESLARIKEQQAFTSAKFEVADELAAEQNANQEFDQKLAQTKPTQKSAQAVLDKIMADKK